MKKKTNLYLSKEEEINYANKLLKIVEMSSVMKVDNIDIKTFFCDEIVFFKNIFFAVFFFYIKWKSVEIA